MRRIILIASTVFICSCVGNTGTKQIESANKIKEIHLVSRPDSIIKNISDIASDVQYIRLQKTTNSNIKAVDKIIVSKNKIYVSLVNNLLIFDNEGRFLCKLSGIEKEDSGRFDIIYDFDISSDDSTLMVLSGDNKILKFNNTGTEFVFIESIDPGKRAPSKFNIVPGTDNILLSFVRVYGNETTLNELININGDILFFKPNNFKRLNGIQSGSSAEIINYKFDKSLCFKEKYNDTVFSIKYESKNFIPEVVLDSRLSDESTKIIYDLEYWRMRPQVTNIFEGSRYLYYCYFFSQYHKVFYDKYENKKYEINPGNGVLKDDIGGGPDFDPKFCSEGKIYSWIGTRELKKYIGSEDFTKEQVQNLQKQKDLKKLVLSLKDTDNPVLVLVRLKN